MSSGRQELGATIKAHRESLGLSQRALACRLGNHRRHVIKWEKGQTAPGPRYRRLLGAIFDVPPESLKARPDSPEKKWAEETRRELRAEYIGPT